MPTELEKTVGEALAKECRLIFGTTWSNDVRWRFARAAIEAIDASIKKPKSKK